MIAGCWWLVSSGIIGFLGVPGRCLNVNIMQYVVMSGTRPGSATLFLAFVPLGVKGKNVTKTNLRYQEQILERRNKAAKHG